MFFNWLMTNFIIIFNVLHIFLEIFLYGHEFAYCLGVGIDDFCGMISEGRVK